VATAGWTQTGELGTEAVLERLHESGVRELVYTNVDRDGMLEGPDLEEVRLVAAAVRGEVIYSGGIGKLADLEGLAELREASLTGVIVGKALYEGRFTVGEAHVALGG
jgi:phosphoribosylformimino-5-aminoimidazole carboxamide ribotide isomerase